MTCDSCEKTVKQLLTSLPGIDSASVSYPNQVAYIKGPKLPTDSTIHQALLKKGYALGKEPFPWLFVVGALAVGLAAMGLSYLYGKFVFDPQDQPFTLGVVVLYGLVSSLHCIGMCGGLALGASVQSKTKVETSMWLYQGGRLISYTLSGLILGLVGQRLQINPFISDLLLLVAGIWMLVLALKMAGLLRFRGLELPLQTRDKGPFVVGLLNALMPCGSLQTMQILSLSLGSAWMGALTMAVFAIVTAPSLLFMQWFGQRLSLSHRKNMQVFAAILVAVLGLQMTFRSPLVTQALTLVQGSIRSEDHMAPVVDGVQKIQLRIDEGRYTLDYADVKAGVPISITFSATQFLGCANPIEFDFLSPAVEIDVLKQPADLVFTIDQPGSYVIHCWMNMVKITLYVH